MDDIFWDSDDPTIGYTEASAQLMPPGVWPLAIHPVVKDEGRVTFTRGAPTVVGGEVCSYRYHSDKYTLVVAND